MIATIRLFGCVNGNPSRYQLITSGGIAELKDMKMLDVYYSYGANWHKVSPQGVETIVDELPQ